MSFVKKNLKYFLVVVFSTVLVTLSIKASDSLIGDDGDANLCPSEMVFVPSANGGFCIDRFEVSPGSDCPVGETNNQADSRKNMTSMDCKPISVKGSQPWIYISQTQAREACARVGKRLPTNKEWLSASLGTPDKNSLWEEDDCQVARNWKKQPGKTGSGEKCVSSFGVFDMIGNIWEWTDETLEDGILDGKKLPESGFVYELNEDGIASETGSKLVDNYNNDYFWIKNKGSRAVARGGFFSNEEKAGIYSAYLVSKPSYTGVGVGFRCVK